MGILEGMAYLQELAHLKEGNMKKIILFIIFFISIIAKSQYTPEDSVWFNGRIQDWKLWGYPTSGDTLPSDFDSAIVTKFKMDAVHDVLFDTIPKIYLRKDELQDSIENANFNKLNTNTLNSDNYTDGTYNYTLSQLASYSTSFLSDLDTFSVEAGTVVFVVDEEKNYYYNGVIWQEVTSTISSEGNELNFDSTFVEEIIDYQNFENDTFLQSHYYETTNHTYCYGNHVDDEGYFYDKELVSTGTVTIRDSSFTNSQGYTVISKFHPKLDSLIWSCQFYSASTVVVGGQNIQQIGDTIVTGILINGDMYTSFKDTIYYGGTGYEYYLIYLSKDGEILKSILTGINTTQTFHGYFDIDRYGNVALGIDHRGTYTIYSNGITTGNTHVVAGQYQLCFFKYSSSGELLVSDYNNPLSSVTAGSSMYDVESYKDGYLFSLKINHNLEAFGDTLKAEGTTVNTHLVRTDFNLQNIWILRCVTSSDNDNLSKDEGIFISNLDEIYFPTHIPSTTANIVLNKTDTIFYDSQFEKAGGEDGYLLKLNSDGSLSNYYVFYGSGNDEVYRPQVLDGIMYVPLLTVSNDLYYRNNNIGVSVSSGDAIIFSLKEENGDLLNYIHIGGTNNQEPRKINSDNVGNLLVSLADAGGGLVLGDSTYTNPGGAVYSTALFRYGIDTKNRILNLGKNTVIGDYENDQFIRYSVIDTSLQYENPPSSFSGNEIPSMTAVQNEISDIDSSWQKSSHDTIQGNSSDTININATTKFEGGIRITTVTESFSVSKTISFIDQYYAEMTVTNNTVITIDDIPEGTSPQLSLIWSGGDYTVSISGATQMSGNSTISLQELNGATDLIQFKKINGTDYYSIINVVTP